jgi:hypothetical protein
MPHFTKRFITYDGSVRFTFSRIFTANGIIYFLSFIDNDHKAQSFHMVQNKQGRWEILDKIIFPEWLQKLEKELSQAIVEHRS